jgi:hypothetical protein
MAVYKTRQDFSRALLAGKEDLKKLQAVASRLAAFDQPFASRVLDLVSRWDAFVLQARPAARTLTGWEKHADMLDQYQREIGVYKNAASKKIQEMEAHRAKVPGPPTPPKRPKGAGPPAKRGPTAVGPPAVPGVIRQNIGPIAAGVGVGVLVLFALARKKKR